MDRAARAAAVSSALDRLFPEVPIPLRHSDPYTLLVAVLLSAQCTDARVNEVTRRLFARAATPAAMLRIAPDELLDLVRPCGLGPAKSRAIHGLSRILLEEHGGRVPRTFAELEALPGVGHKTASVVMSQAFGQAAFPVDTHIHRLAQRWRLTNGRSVEQTEADLKRLFPPERWNRLHLQIIYYGRAYCTARGCDGLTCPICSTVNAGRKTPVPTRK